MKAQVQKPQLRKLTITRATDVPGETVDVELWDAHYGNPNGYGSNDSAAAFGYPTQQDAVRALRTFRYSA